MNVQRCATCVYVGMKDAYAREHERAYIHLYVTCVSNMHTYPHVTCMYARMDMSKILSKLHTYTRNVALPPRYLAFLFYSEFCRQVQTCFPPNQSIFRYDSMLVCVCVCVCVCVYVRACLVFFHFE